MREKTTSAGKTRLLGALVALPPLLAPSLVLVPAPSVPPTTTTTAATTATRTASARPGIAAAASVRADFDGDGSPDLVVGAPGETVGRTQQAGGFTVVYGGGRAPVSVSQDSVAVPGTAESDDGFGASLAVGNFDGDGFADLAVGAPGEDIGPARDAGSVTVFAGSAGGLRPVRVLHQGSEGVPGDNEAEDVWTSALGAGDLDGDRRDDLAVGAPGEALGARNDAGAVTVLFGGSSGLTPAGSRFLTQKAGTPEAGDGFGAAVAVGDVTGTDSAELVVGVPGEDSDEGAVTTYGDLAPAGQATTSSAVTLRGRVAGARGLFGVSLALGDLDRDGRADVAVGAPVSSAGRKEAAGAVAVLYGGTVGGLGSGPGERRQVLTQDSARVPGTAEAGDFFGSSLSAGDVTGDGAADLAVGAPGEGIGARRHAGSVVVLPGAASGVSGEGAWFLSQDSPGVGGTAEEGDAFGQSVTASGGRLVVGAPGEALDGAQVAGAYSLFSEGADGSRSGALVGEAALGGTPRPGEGFGAALAG